MKPKHPKKNQSANSTANITDISTLRQLEQHFQYISPIRATSAPVTKTPSSPYVAVQKTTSEEQDSDESGDESGDDSITDQINSGTSPDDSDLDESSSEKIKSRPSPDAKKFSSRRRSKVESNQLITSYFQNTNEDAEVVKGAKNGEGKSVGKTKVAFTESSEERKQKNPVDYDDIEMIMWHGGGRKRKVADIFDLDLVLHDLGDVAAGVKYETNLKSCRRALDRFMRRTQEDIHKMIETVEEVKGLQLLVAKKSSAVKQKRDSLFDLNQEVLQNEEEVEELQRKRALLLKKKASSHNNIDNINAWLHQVEQLH